MTRELMVEGMGTKFGKWIRDKCRKSSKYETKNGRPGGLCVTNLDYVFESYSPIVALGCKKGLMLLEEKAKYSDLEFGQQETFRLLDRILREHAHEYGYVYWGFFLLQLSGIDSSPSDEGIMLLNAKQITERELIDHIDFYHKFCDGMFDA